MKNVLSLLLLCCLCVVKTSFPFSYELPKMNFQIHYLIVKLLNCTEYVDNIKLPNLPIIGKRSLIMNKFHLKLTLAKENLKYLEKQFERCLGKVKPEPDTGGMHTAMVKIELDQINFRIGFMENLLRTCLKNDLEGHITGGTKRKQRSIKSYNLDNDLKMARKTLHFVIGKYLTCIKAIDYCKSKPCKNGGSCVEDTNHYTCNCMPGYTGKHCQTDIDECEKVSCKNHGSCIDGINSYTCHCPPGFTSKHCQTDIDDCKNKPCGMKGSCVDGVNSYTCKCMTGYSGTHCEKGGNRCGSILHSARQYTDRKNKKYTVPQGWILCYIDSKDFEHRRTPCEDLLVNVGGYKDAKALKMAGGKFGCWHGRTGHRRGPAYASNNIIKNACYPKLQHKRQHHSTMNSWWSRRPTFGVCIKLP